MFTNAQLDEIQRQLWEGKTDGEISSGLNISINQFRYGLLRSGKSIFSRRELIDAVPLGQIHEAQGKEVAA